MTVDFVLDKTGGNRMWRTIGCNGAAVENDLAMAKLFATDRKTLPFPD